MTRTLFGACVLSIFFAGSAFADRIDPLPAFVFLVKIDGTTLALQSCGQIGSTTEVVEFQQGSGGIVQHVPGKTTFLPLNCTRSLTADMTFYNWRRSIELGNLQRKPIDVQLLDTAFNVVTTFHLFDTWPSSLFIEKLDVTSNDTLKENISIVVDGMTRE